MSEWIPPGHRPHDGHPDDDVRWCECSGRCTQGAPCDCCELAELRAEVERLTAKVEQVKQASAELVAERDRRIDAAIGMLDAELKYERNLGRHLSLTQISDALRGGGFADRAETAEAEVERLTDALAERDRRIAATLALTFPVPGDVYDLDSYTKGLADAQAAVTASLRVSHE